MIVAVPPIANDSEMVAYLSAEMQRRMRSLSIPGAVLVLVRGDAVLMKAAFGTAVVDRNTPVDVDRTSFRIASVSKVFTSIAALRAVERGRIGLRDDVRSLVPEIPITGRDPVTLHELLTHTAGFDERLVGYLNPAGASAEPLDRYLTRSMPARSRRPSDVPSYSNHGYALAGLVVERVTRLPFATFVRDSVFVPLRMNSTSFVRDARDTVGRNVAAEYRATGERRTMRTSRAYPAGNVATTGADMARFLVALNRASRGDSTGPLSPRIAHWLIGPSLVYSAQLPPMGYGLSGIPMSGRVVWIKGGASPSHSAVIAVVPELELAMFIAVNRQEPLLWDQLLPAFVDRFFKDSTVRASPPRVETVSLGGTYRWTRSALTGFEKILGLAVQLVVHSEANGIRVSGGGELNGVYEATDSLLFERHDGRRIAFRVDASGRPSYVMSTIQGQPVAFERIGSLESARVQLGVVGIATVLAIVASIAAMRERSLSTPAWARGAVVALPIVEIATFVIALGLARQTDLLVEGPTTLLRLALGATTVLAVLAIAHVVSNARLATTSYSRVRRAIHWSGAVGGGGIVWFLVANDLVGHWPS